MEPPPPDPMGETFHATLPGARTRLKNNECQSGEARTAVDGARINAAIPNPFDPSQLTAVLSVPRGQPFVLYYSVCNFGSKPSRPAAVDQLLVLVNSGNLILGNFPFPAPPALMPCDCEVYSANSGANNLAPGAYTWRHSYFTLLSSLGVQ